MRLSRSLCAGLVFAAAACRQNDDPEGAEDLLVRVQEEGYRSWARAPGYEERKPSDAPHSDNVEIFVNPVMQEVLAGLPGSASQWPTGSIVVKDGYDEAGELALTAIMEKRSDGWYWAEYDAEGVALYSGAPAICTDCHASGSDFVRAFSLP